MQRKPTKRSTKKPTKKVNKYVAKAPAAEQPVVVTVEEKPRPSEDEAKTLVERMIKNGLVAAEQRQMQIAEILKWNREAFDATNRIVDSTEFAAQLKSAHEEHKAAAPPDKEEPIDKYSVLEKLEALVLVRQAAHFRAQRELARANEMLKKAGDHVASGNEDMSEFRSFFNAQVGIKELNLSLCLRDSDEMTRALFDMEPYRRERPKTEFHGVHGRMGMKR
jgi:hypothetical protein